MSFAITYSFLLARRPICKPKGGGGQPSMGRSPSP